MLFEFLHVSADLLGKKKCKVFLPIKLENFIERKNLCSIFFRVKPLNGVGLPVNQVFRPLN